MTDKTSDNSADLSVSSLFLLPSYILHQPSDILLLLPVVIHHLDSEDNHTASEGDEVGE
jgi:hypothetical protein